MHIIGAAFIQGNNCNANAVTWIAHLPGMYYLVYQS